MTTIPAAIPSNYATKRRYTVEDIDDTIDNWTNKGYLPDGKTIYVKSKKYGYDVAVIDKNGNPLYL